ncbi:MAG: hypothetical protein A2X56_15040 [Nitrospirae bacterium GWC2_57_13]|jgi:polyisoprenoid-binding protein YceI|nr:MAG: hypothetical protein A2072_05330 [Nitrospirae bacterium GWC1_57_7]OGW28024.1 MAG: hypothetical protein A2X56_15040 [Nitrospirae bacterium GWC2_57_13]OGW43832.1 MAG: hypothetical protein A2X57_08035 [Nitrospirae bacterium GWD2_57_8]HAR44830.1 polyisoprenoid-binding protein [Nitrospiraceae bacterium]HAS53499.1 polyisoprenoid-binding protein [Nitrospiraceae bacterium]
MKTWTIDSDHSVAAFSIRYLMLAKIRGQCNKMKGMIRFDPADISGSSVEVTFDVAGVTTGIKKRDEHLMSGDFFDVKKYPAVTFKSTAAEKTGVNSCKVTGNLTIHGVTRPVAFEADFVGPAKSPMGGELSMGFMARTVINREDFGMTWNEPMEGGGLMLAKDVEITLDVEADLAE